MHKADASERAVLSLLQQGGVVECSAQQEGEQLWRFTKVGVEQLRCHWLVSHPRPFLARARAAALGNQTSYELLLGLVEQGWSWARWVPPSQRRRAHAAHRAIVDAYIPSAPQVFYTGKVPQRPYLELLHRSAEMFARGLDRIPHGRTAVEYSRIFRGDFAVARLQWQERHRVMDVLGRDVHDVGDDVGACGALGALEDEAPGDLVPAVGEEEEQEEEQEEEAEAAGNLATAVGDVVPEPRGAIPSQPSGVDSRRSRALPERSGQNLVADAGAAGAAEGAALMRSGRFGVFRLTPKQPGTSSSGAYGGLQATCPFHRLNARSGCKKFVTIRGPSVEDKSAALRVLLQWCVEAPNYSRQRYHMAVPLAPESAPPWAFLLSRRIDDEPRGPVQTDAELDAAEAAEVVGAEAGDVVPLPRGGGKGRGGRRRDRGRGRGSEGGRAPQRRRSPSPSPVPSGTSSSSSSSNTGSSSSSSAD